MRAEREPAESLVRLGFEAFTTTRAAGSYGTSDDAPVREVTARWSRVRELLAAVAPRLATASQVHGNRVVEHGAGWSGWLRVDAADGHATAEAGMALAVTIADCVPVFLARRGGPIALLHAGWRGTAAGILHEGVRALGGLGAQPHELVMHLGPAICGPCYEVSPAVYQSLTGTPTDRPATVDLREILSRQAHALGIREITSSPACTRCGESQFFSHRAGDRGRQIALLALPR